ncbi:hypothetical protein GGX14DRAFT_404759 [Mycena pura]|uniref:DUF6535 domain-containing protein n=1 Tax=Mycena pura TaxID=153505 RepID=A0AAD6Y4X7_9AGAR|nr:hypothetical protein GGX14DRAFT_404759 [Mycena pura]
MSLFANLAGPASERDPSHDDAAGRLWSVYISEAEKYDKELVESWKSNMEGMLIFAGLFAASLTAFLIESYKTLSADSSDTTNFLLTQISQQLAASAAANGTGFITTTPPSFTPTAASVICNVLWFISLGLSLTCALFATLLEQWARDFLHRADMRSAPATRARMFSYLYYGLKRFNLHTVVEIIPLLLHMSLLLFFGGLVAFLSRINIIVTGVAAAILIIVMAMYFLLTILPLLALDCPYRTPLSRLVWNVVQALLRSQPNNKNDQQPASSGELPTMVEAIFHAATEFSNERKERDINALIWTTKSLANDVELEPFLEAIPEVLWGPYSRRHVYDDHIYALLHHPEIRLLDRIREFFLSSRKGSVTEEVKRRRRMISYKALWAILSVYEATDPSKPLPKLWGTSTYEMSSSDSAVDPYKTSVLALIRWHEIWQRRDKITEVLGMLRKCEQDITAGQTPDFTAISESLSRSGNWEFNMIKNEIWQYNNNPDGSAASLIPKWILEIQNTHFTAPCENLIHYLGRASQSNSPPYEFDRTESLISPQMFPGCIYPKNSIEYALDKLVYNHMDRFNNGAPENWLDNVVRNLFLYWEPLDGSNTYPTLPRSIIHYLSLRDSWPALHKFCLQFTATNDRFWACMVNNLLGAPCLPPGVRPSTEGSEDPENSQTLNALWQLLRHTGELGDEPLWPSLKIGMAILNAMHYLPLSSATMAAIPMVKHKILLHLCKVSVDGEMEEHLHTYHHDILPAETAISITNEQLQNILSQEDLGLFKHIMIARVKEARMIMITEILERCNSNVVPQRITETVPHLGPYNLQTAIHSDHQIRFAKSIEALLSAPDVSPVLFRLVIDLHVWSVYAPNSCIIRIADLQLHPWLDDRVARQIIQNTFVYYQSRFTATDPPEIQSKVKEILHGLDFFHSASEGPGENNTLDNEPEKELIDAAGDNM